MSDEFKFWLFVVLFVVLPLLQWIMRKITSVAQSPQPARRRPVVVPEKSSRADEEDGYREDRGFEVAAPSEGDEWIEHDLADDRERTPSPSPVIRADRGRIRPGKRPEVLGDLGSFLEEVTGMRVQAAAPPPPPPKIELPKASRPAESAAPPITPIRASSPALSASQRRRARNLEGALLGEVNPTSLRSILAWSEVLAPPLSLRPPEGGGRSIPQIPSARSRSGGAASKG